MARLIYGDLLGVNFTIGADSTPNSTNVPKLITLYYQKCYRYLYGPGKYSADESTDTKNIIDMDDFRAELNSLVSHKVQLWNEAGKNADGSVRPMPKMDLYYKNTDAFVRRQFVDFLDTLLETNESREYIDNTRLWGSDYSDRSGLFY